jgi:hypothetical protein
MTDPTTGPHSDGYGDRWLRGLSAWDNRLRARDALIAAETAAADARMDAEGWERTARAAEAREADLLERGDHRGAVLSLRQQRDRLAARVEALEGSLAMIRRRAVEHPKGLTPGYVLAAIDTPECDLPQRPRALVSPDTPTSPTDTGDAQGTVVDAAAWQDIAGDDPGEDFIREWNDAADHNRALLGLPPETTDTGDTP